MMAVKTNVGYQEVAMFVCQHEDADSIAEALQMIRDYLTKNGIKIDVIMTDVKPRQRRLPEYSQVLKTNLLRYCYVYKFFAIYIHRLDLSLQMQYTYVIFIVDKIGSDGLIRDAMDVLTASLPLFSLSNVLPKPILKRNLKMLLRNCNKREYGTITRSSRRISMMNG